MKKTYLLSINSKTEMFFKLSILFSLLVITNILHSQNPLLNSANAQMRGIFSQISYPSPNVQIFVR